MPPSTADSGAIEAESEKTVAGSSGSCPARSVRGEVVLQPLTEQQKQVVASYWLLARKSAHELKRKIKKIRALTTEESDYIEDWMTEWLMRLVQQADPGTVNYSAYLTASLNNRIAWYREKRREPVEELTEEAAAAIEARPEQFDVVEYTGCPHREVVRKIVESHDSMTKTLSHGERKRWQRYQKKEVQQYLRKLYELGSD